MDEWLMEVTRSRTVSDWVSLLEQAQVPGGPINDIAHVFADPHVVARGMRMDLPHAKYGSVPSIRNPIRFSETPLEFSSAPPQLGEHTAEVLQSLELSPDEMRQLHDEGVL
jgi:crotonobetainyl-CoA:carnitine CoA-transferase CaiB-like acyl-CoA transferase